MADVDVGVGEQRLREVPAMTVIDRSTEFGTRATRRLENERIIWLTTVRADLRPEPSPVWFHWDGGSFLIYSQPRALKVRNIAARPQVSLSLNIGANDSDVVVLSGIARIVEGAPPAREVPVFVEKYVRLGGIPSAEAFAELMDSYDVAIRVTPTRLRGF